MYCVKPTVYVVVSDAVTSPCISASFALIRLLVVLSNNCFGFAERLTGFLGSENTVANLPGCANNSACITANG